jgi:hypothetical protein
LILHGNSIAFGFVIMDGTNTAWFVHKHSADTGESYGSGFSGQCHCRLMQFFYSWTGTIVAGPVVFGRVHVCHVGSFMGHIAGLDYPPVVYNRRRHL